jgi:hypothetical protein
MWPDSYHAYSMFFASDWGILRLGVLLEVGDVKHARDGRRVFLFLRGVDRQLAAGLRLAVGPKLLVVGVGSAHCDGSNGGRVGDVLAAGVNGALGGGIFGAVALQSAEIYPSFSGHPTEAPLPEGMEPVFFR